eukprot:8660694-Prorocentrum_lima.AAC.1
MEEHIRKWTCSQEKGLSNLSTIIRTNCQTPSTSNRFELFGRLPLTTGLRGHRYVLVVAHRLKWGEDNILIPWVAPIKLKSDAPKEILK